MLSMQNNPNSTTSNACKDQIALANAEVANMLNFSTYTSGSFNFGELMNKAQIMMFKLQGEFELCGYDQFLISWDGLMSNWGALSGGLASLTTQFTIGGFNGFKQAAYISIFEIRDGWNNKDWKKFGEGLQLLFSETVHYEAPVDNIDLVPVS